MGIVTVAVVLTWTYKSTVSPIPQDSNVALVTRADGVLEQE